MGLTMPLDQPEPRVHVAALAEIVQDLLAGGPALLRNDLWLRVRVAAAGLDTEEDAALELLCSRLRDGGQVLADILPLDKWL